MNLPRIAELKNIISRLYSILKELKNRMENLEKEGPRAAMGQEKLTEVVSSAVKRVSSLNAFGFRPGLLDDIVDPVRGHPDCGGIGSTITKELAKIVQEIQKTDNQIFAADQEKRQLEMEEV